MFLFLILEYITFKRNIKEEEYVLEHWKKNYYDAANDTPAGNVGVDKAVVTPG